MILHVTLPDLDTLDADALRAIILRQHEQLLSRDHELEHLKLLIAKLQRMQFGHRSEKIAHQIEQLELKLEELQSERAADEGQQLEEPFTTPTPDDAAAPAKPTRTKRALPDHLPRETRMHTPAEPCCPECGGTLSKLGEDVSEVLEYIPASFRVIRHVRPKLSCTACDVIVQAPAPSRPIERSIAGPGLLAHIMTSKFADHLPLNRQSEIYAREGVDLDRSMLAKWVGQTSRLLDPLLEALRRYVFSASKLHGDDTPVPVLAPGNGKTKTGRLWTYVRDDRPAGDGAAPAVWFAYSPDRKGEHPQQHLRDFKGILQADAYAGFNRLYQDGSIQQAPCLAHIRRKFNDLKEALRSPIAIEALERIAPLYKVEEEIRGRSPGERQQVRSLRSRPIMNSLCDWFEASLAKLSPKSDTTAAIRYALSNWEALTRYCDDGRREIDNNAAERALRCVAIGRRNYLFAGSDRGGERAATFYSLIGSAKLNGLNPEAYLREVFERIADHPITRIEELLPWNIGTHAN
jgi:transposase